VFFSLDRSNSGNNRIDFNGEIGPLRCNEELFGVVVPPHNEGCHTNGGEGRSKYLFSGILSGGRRYIYLDFSSVAFKFQLFCPIFF